MEEHVTCEDGQTTHKEPNRRNRTEATNQMCLMVSHSSTVGALLRSISACGERHRQGAREPAATTQDQTSHSSLKTASESQIPDKVVRDESWEQSHGRSPGSWMQLLPAQPNVVTENVI